MNAKKILSVLALLLTTHSVFSQKVDIDRQRFSVRRTLPPRNPVASGYTQISPVAQTSPITRRYVDREMVESQIRVDGYETVYGIQDAIHVDFWLSNFEILSTDFDKRVVEKKDKNGKVTSTQTFYKHIMVYNLDHYYTVSLPNGDPVYASASRFSNRSLRHESQEFDTYKGAANYWRNNRENIVSEAIINYVNGSIADMNRFLSYEIGFARENYSTNLWIMDSKKHPENETHQMHTMNLVNGLKTLDYGRANQDLYSELSGSLGYFEDLSKMKVRDKHSKRLVKSALINLAEFYYLMDNPIKSKFFAQQLIDRDVDKGDGKSLINKADRLQTLFDENEIYSTHFQRGIDSVPSEDFGVSTVVNTIDLKSDAPKYLKGMVITANEKEFIGYFVNDFYKKPWKIQDGVSFVSEAFFNGGNYKNSAIQKFTPNGLKGMAVNDIFYLSTPYSDPERIGTNGSASSALTQKYLIEVLMEGDYMLYKYYGMPPPDKVEMYTGADVSQSILILRDEDKKAQVLSTVLLEEILEMKPTLFQQYKDGKFSIDGKKVNTKRSTLEKMNAKLALDDNIDFLKIFKTLNGK